MASRTVLKIAMCVAMATGAAVPAQAAPSAIDTLLSQARYWNAKGRADLARAALNRVLAIDPNNAEARAALARPTAPKAPPKPVAKPAAAPTAPAPAARAPARAKPSDSGGDARAAGFAALNSGKLDVAAARFQAALKVQPGDRDALGGLGLVRLRAKKFAEARDLLTRASAGGNAGKWATALAAAQFYGDMDDARAALNAGRLDQAEQIARRLATSDFKDRDNANLLLGEILSRQGRTSEAATVYAQAGAAGAASSGALRAQAARAQAQQLAATGDLAGAVKAFQTAVAADPSDPWVRYQYAIFLADQGHQGDAAAVIAPLAAMNTPEALYAGALFYDHVGSPMTAAARMAQIPAEQMTPEMREFAITMKTGEAIDRIKAMQAQGNIGGALAGARALAAGPQVSVRTLGAVADLLMSMGDEAGAQALAQRAAAMPLAEPGDYQSVVGVLARSGQDIEASTLIARFGGSADSGAIARLNAVLAANQADRMRLAGQNAAAFDVLRSAYANAPQDHDILGALARLYQGGGMPGQAQQVYAMLIAQKADDVGALSGYAEAAAAARDYDNAGQAIERALTIAPRNADVYLAAARVEQARGHKGAALKYLKQARALAGGDAGLANGAPFEGGNPFANASGNPFAGGAAAAPPNPFALPARPSGGGGGRFTPVGAPLPPVGGGFGPANPFGQLPAARAGGAADPTLARIDREIAALAGEAGSTIEASTSYRNRSGEAGLSKLNQIGATVTASTHIGNAKISASVSPVVLDAGSMSRSGLARFGTNPTAEATGIVNQAVSQLTLADTQHDAGVAASVAITVGALKADVGATPMGFRKTNVEGGASFTPKLGDHVTVGIHGERRAVTDSLLSYAGTIDPVSGLPWGSVMRSGGGGSLSFDTNGSGIYADGAYHRYDGVNVRANRAFEGNIGGYINIYREGGTSVTGGANLNYQTFDNNQNYFSYGHGGYFSPQSFVAVAFPLHYRTEKGNWKAGADFSPGFQSYQQDAVPVYPTLPAAQAQLDTLKGRNTDVRSSYDSLSKSGFAFAGSASGSYRVGGATEIGGEVKYNSFGVYNEFQTLLSIRQSLSGSGK
ncbi:cellulose biosynthesis protein BcsC [Sphingomonas sp. NFR15]|uniref:cellulose biosynthesis protein BcsC n=1 Tax=Sphingomonas sp. NFR15 TaxID=1566282 RepID=UPI000884446D|nr:cellulose biosynthesis protein BcsC [Sphingomonas sp. NFR15]SDA28290.1 Tetratricopeptide repeat-containing protein [Sphingomonas sp. NFR15]